ncbi:carbohydrate kinase family protein [Pontibacter sp. 13R65]|uniref:carbohydrate kinase family protein n=1 Tax=Pontibacter sp. 13R65 TaxID=3127458 RepID=UPI00301BC2F9
MRNGILVSGNWIIDHVKLIDVFPEEEKLVSILAEYSCNGGSAFNVVKGLAKLKAPFPISGLGLIGDDERGEKILQDCSRHQIDTSQLRKTTEAHTSYTDVMSVKCTGKRTFFHQRGANALLDMHHFDFAASQAKIFHLGYLLLLDKLDVKEADGTTRAAKVLKSAQNHGFITSADIVSERSNRFRETIPSSLPYLDYLFVNEFEASMITGIETVQNGQVLEEKCTDAAWKLLEMGVNRWVILHFPAGAIAVSKTGEQLFQPSINLPSDKIAGASGAGDAFAAGILMGVHENWEMSQCLQLGVCAAARSLFAATSSDGILPATECLQLAQQYGFRNATVQV